MYTNSQEVPQVLHNNLFVYMEVFFVVLPTVFVSGAT